MKLNLFKKQTETLEDTVPQETVINSKTIGEDLRKSFEQVLAEFNLNPSKETEIEKLKQKLDNFKEDNKSIYDKIEKLKSLGLVNTPTAKKSLEKLIQEEERINTEIADIKKEISAREKDNELYHRYLEQYKGYKFISREVMINIMKKYDLVLGEAFTYAKEIPDEALNIISNFTEEINNSKKITYLRCTYNGWGGYWYEFEDAPAKADRESRFFSSDEKEFETTNLKFVAPKSHFDIPVLNLDDENTILMKINEDTRMFEFNKSALEKVNKKLREVLDPIACLEVEGGYIILHAWDKEAEIEEIKL